MLRFVFAALLLPACAALAGAADLDPESNEPYYLDVVLRFAKHPSLNTPYFQDQVKRDLQDNLQVALGALARVEVMRKHDLLAEVELKGLEKALDSWKTLNKRKTHFVFVDFVNGDYQLQARQHDGSTGLASPVVRKQRLADRQLVARTASLMVAQDFGIVGTIPAKAQGNQVDMILKGGGLGAPLEDWVAKNEVFALALIGRPVGGVQRSERQRWTLVQALEAPRNGVLPCRILNRYEPPLSHESGIMGYRCLKLGTTQAPLRLRVVADKLGTPLNHLQVSVSSQEAGFSDAEGQATNADGLIKTVKEYRHVAFVRIADNKQPLTRTIPVEILGDRVVGCEVKVERGAEQRGQLFLRRDRWLQQINDNIGIAYSLAKEWNATVDQSREAARDKTKAGLEALGEETRKLRAEHENLRKESGGIALRLEEGEQRIKDLEALRSKIEGYITKLDQIIKDEKDPKRQKWEQQVLKAKNLEDEAEYEKAFGIFDQLLQESGDKNLQSLVDGHKEQWRIKNDKHKEARQFIYETWPQLRTAIAMKDRLAEARKAFETCKEVGDHLTPRKLKLANNTHAGDLAREAESLKPDVNEDDARIAKAIVEVADVVGALNKEIDDYVAQGK